jgi:SAM-dependent methyltransferase
LKGGADRAHARWQKAQLAEHEFWRKSKHPEDREFWERILRSGFGLTLDFFAKKDVLEIGSGPCGMIYGIAEAKLRIGVEPMKMSDLIERWKRKFLAKGVGEALPFNDESFDAVICFNVLDHCKEPSIVLRECSRVLRKGGTLLLWIHVLRSSFKLLQSSLDRLDTPHPYHFTEHQVMEIVRKHFIIQWKNRAHGAGLVGHAKVCGKPKVLLANYVTESLTMRLARASGDLKISSIGVREFPKLRLMCVVLMVRAHENCLSLWFNF